MPHQYVLFAQCLGKRSTFVLGMPGKHKIGHAGQYLETKPDQLCCKLCACINNGPAHLLEIGSVFYGGHRSSLSHGIQRIGVEAVLERIQALDNLRLGDGKAYTPARTAERRVGKGFDRTCKSGW